MLLLFFGDIESCPHPIFLNETTRNSPEMNSLLGKWGIKISHQDVQCLFSKINLVSVFPQSFHGINDLTLSETHIENDGEHSAFCNIPGYSFVSRPRNAGKGGGVGIYISDDATERI